MSASESYAKEMKTAFRQFADFPIKGEQFEDFLPIIGNPKLFQTLINMFKAHLEEKFGEEKIDFIAGIEARGLLFGPSLALALGVGFVPIRRAGKLPGECATITFTKSDHEETFEMQVEAIPFDSNVVIVDDVLATGGSASAAGDLIKQVGAHILEYDFVLTLDSLHGEEKLSAPIFSMIHS
ncbi:Apt2p [Saccharomyces cerevisiae x Saccharomyces kudriavzevii VIN7]|uniref:adenine phosphoribosyltransferase n=1 Tax=Saccharomyces cerevisiae x Saccharomyces kudriavzevii (strain VIN7) TaxID=1095631 RepID=H0GTE1_SACCK|nr:Apt2p [Saccharomyces cerevisiae x Saccharomyces kudriavzevii VIN7]